MTLLKDALLGGSNLGDASFTQLRLGRSLFGQINSDAFGSAYPSIRAISNEYMTVPVHAIDKNGKKLENNEVVNALYHPNQIDSSVAFFEKIAVSTLSLKKTYLLVWRREGRETKPGGDFTIPSTKIGGFTFLEFPGITRRDGRTYYQVGAQEFSDREVIVLPGGVDANDLYGGYSPSESARRWTKLDDYIADFQAGFFENGAVPAGQFIVTARSAVEYNEIVDTLQARHRGAGKNGNVTYSHKPIDPETGKASNAQIEWMPFSQSNKDIDFKNLFDQVNQRLNEAYGVPAIVKGTDSAAKYDNAQVADRNFSKRAVYPLLLRNYTQITHELNRITDGLGFAITFTYKFPVISDEEKVSAETLEIQYRTLKLAVEDGFTLDSTVDALKLPLNFKLLKTGNSTTTEIDNDKPDVDEGGEVESSPNPEKIDGITPLDKKVIVKNQLSESDIASFENQMQEPPRKLMNKQVEDAVAALELSDSSEASQEDKDTFVDEMMVIVETVLLYGGAQQWTDGKQLLLDAGLAIPDGAYEVSEEAISRYRTYLKDIANSYTDDTAESIRGVLAQANEKSWTKQQIQDALRQIPVTEEWRVTRLSTSEMNRSGSLSGVESMVKIQNESTATIEKSMMTTSGNPCEFCRARADQWVAVDKVMVEKGAEVRGVDGGVMVNNWDDNFGHDIHPHGACVPQYRVVRN